MNYAYLITGGNVGDRDQELLYASKLVSERCGTVIDRSALYETEPWGKTDQNSFLNQALVVETPLKARDVLNEILYIENLMGRHREEKYGPRIIDIDIIFFNHEIINAQGLTLPHPRMSERRFVLEPLNQVIPAYIHPVFYKTVAQLLAECPDQLRVTKLGKQLT